MRLLRLVRLMARRSRLLIISWLVLLVALSTATVSAYQSTYPTEEQLRAATELAQHNAATTLMYGVLVDPGTPAQMFTWEVGAIATILAAVMAVLVAISLTRAPEDEGTLEIVRAAGIHARSPLRGAFVILVGITGILTVGCAGGLGLAVGHVDAVTWSGAVTFGVVVGITFLLVGVLTVGLAQVAPTAGGARLLGFGVVGIAFATRAVADTRHVDWLNWLTPFGLRATVAPFTDNNVWPLAISLVAVVALARVATFLSDRREYGAGLLRRRGSRDTRLKVHSSVGLAVRLSRQSILIWAVAVACGGTMFAAMGSGVVQRNPEDDLGGFLGSQIGTGDAVSGYLAFGGTVVGLVVTAFAVLSMLRSRQDEVDGRTDHVLATGTRRWAPLAAQVVVTAGGTLIILVGTGLLSALIAPTVISGPDVAIRAFGYTVGQWPAALVATGWTALLIGLRPRLTGLAWLPLVAGGVLALLGPLLGLPQAILDLGIFQHVPDIAAPSPDLAALLVLLAVSGAAGVLGVVAITRRDLSTG